MLERAYSDERDGSGGLLTRCYRQPGISFWSKGMALKQGNRALGRTGTQIVATLCATSVLCLSPVASSGQAARRSKGAIDARQAIRIAERFVRQNGYTEFVPNEPSRLAAETLEFSRDQRVWLRERHNTLKPRAVGFREGARNHPKGWTVGFELVRPIGDGKEAIGRAVTMDAGGRHLTVQHMGFYLDTLKHRPD
jgi:hypothetical protein